MKRTNYYVLLGIILTAAAVAAGCGSSSTPAATTASPTIGQLADAGKTVFANRCRCHGAEGQGATGPAVIGAGANLGKYGTAQGLLGFIDTTMPANAPGSLTAQQYSEVLCFLLAQNSYVSPGTAFDPEQLKSIALSK